MIAHLVLEPGREVRLIRGREFLVGTSQYSLAEQVAELKHAVVRPLGLSSHGRIVGVRG